MTYHWIEKHPLNFIYHNNTIAPRITSYIVFDIVQRNITIQNENYENYIHLKNQELRK